MFQEDTRLIVVSPVYNGEKWIEKCMESVQSQTYRNYRHVIIDDGSTDDTLSVLANKSIGDPRIIFGGVPRNRGTLHSHILAVEKSEARPHDIIVHLDGDDWLIDDNCLQRIYDTYKNSGCLATYGNYKCSDGVTKSVCKPLGSPIGFREQIKHGWCYSQIRTFYRGMWDRLSPLDFLDPNGKLYSSAADVVIFVPILEMAGKDRVQYIEEESMMYNLGTQISDAKVNLSDQVRCALDVASRRVKSEI